MTQELRLVTIPFSHYCEKARWALDRSGVRYQEQGYLPLLAWVPARKAGGRRTVPVLVTPDGAVRDSTDILHWAEGRGGVSALWPSDSPEVAALEDLFDRSLGPATRRVSYAALIDERPAVATLLDMAPRWQARLARPLLPLITVMLRRSLKLTPAAVARSRARVDEIFADVATRLADGRRYLTGDTFTAADLTFAALAAPVLAPPGYDRWLPPPSLWPEALHTLIAGYRATPAGAFALRVYRDHR